MASTQQEYATLNGSNLTPEIVFNLGFVPDPAKVTLKTETCEGGDRKEHERKPFHQVDPGRVTEPEKVVKIKVADESWQKVVESRTFLEKEAKSRIIYGVNTGFGSNHNTIIPTDELASLQVNLILSHSTGVGKPIPCSNVRMMLVMRINSLIKGYSGVSRENIEKMVHAFNACCLPIVPEQGTVGASGDLAPLAHMVLGLMGEGEMWSPITGVGQAAEVLKQNNLTVLSLGMKEGLALINGTQFICTKGVEALVRAIFLAKQADIVAALTVECLKGTKKAFDPRLHEVKPHAGQVDVARRMFKLLDMKNESEIAGKKAQDPYSLRCCPQVHGVVHETLTFVEKILTTEINSVNDNPIVFADSGDVLSGGNFHGEYPAMAMDFLAIAVNELANISERRIDRLVNEGSSEGLPAFLVKHPGLNSGFMIVQYCAASLVSEGKVLCHPASADSIPTCGGFEDHVSMGGFSARKSEQVVSNAEKVVAMELLSACQAVDLRRSESKENLTLSEPLEKIYDLVRNEVMFMEKDRYIAPDMETVNKMLQARKVWEIAKAFLE